MPPHAVLYREVVVDESNVGRLIGVARASSPTVESALGAAVGSAEHLRAVFERAAAATDRAMGLWLERSTPPAFADRVERGTHASLRDLRALRALVRAAATAYVRRLRQTGVTPERMVVLVKEATRQPLGHGLAVQELTSDVVLWSIEAYFDE